MTMYKTMYDIMYDEPDTKNIQHHNNKNVMILFREDTFF